MSDDFELDLAEAPEELLCHLLSETISAMMTKMPEELVIPFVLQALSDQTGGRFQFMSGNLKPSDIEEVRSMCEKNDEDDDQLPLIH